ncbi:MAG: hypothetical protein ACYDEF_09340 [Methanosarcina sp.]
MGWLINLVVAAGLLEFLGICVYIPIHIKTITSRIKKIEEEIETLKNRRNA